MIFSHEVVSRFQTEKTNKEILILATSTNIQFYIALYWNKMYPNPTLSEFPKKLDLRKRRYFSISEGEKKNYEQQ